MADSTSRSTPPDCSKARLARTSKGGSLDNMVVMTNRKAFTNPMRVGLYDVGDIIGEGNFATVRYARHRHTNSDVAIKIIDKAKLSQADLEKVQREIQIMKLLNHPNITKLYQVMQTKDMLYLVTEYAPNGEMFDHIVKNGNLTESEARKKFWQILSAVEYCHNNRVVHRDLKAENLLLDANGNIKICDFGFGTQFPEDGHLATFCGSPPYAAPELFEGHTYKGPEVDIWSLGVVLYVLVCGGLPFYGENLKDLRDRIVKGIFRIPYWMSQECEHLIRHMLVKDPEKRYSIEQIKKHRWLLADGVPRPIQGFTRTYQEYGSTEEYSEQVLRLMEQLGLERQKTIEQLNKNNVYDHYTAIYHLLLDRMKLHRCSYPLDKQLSSSKQQRRPSTVAENALSHPKYQQHLQACHQQAQQQILPASNYDSCTSDYSINSNPMTTVSSHASIDNRYSTSAESGLEVDMETNEISVAVSKPPLTRRHTLMEMTDISNGEHMLRDVGGPSIDSGHSMEPSSESQSLDSNLDRADHTYNDNFKLAVHPYNLTQTDNCKFKFGRPNDSSSQMDSYINRHQTRSPINFREGRRASDGLVCQDVIAFRQKLKDGMKAGGVSELRQEHNVLLESFSDECESASSRGGGNEPPTKIPLGKRMSLPTSSIDLPPHRLLEIKKSIQLDHHLGRGPEAHDITRPFGALVSYEPVQIHPFSNHPSLQRHYNNGIQRKQVFKQNSALYQQFQQMHLEQSSLVSAGRGGKHPPVTRQPSYKLAQQQTVMPQAYNITALPWEQTLENGNFLLPIATNCMTKTTSEIITSGNNMISSDTSCATYTQAYHNDPYLSQ